MGNQNQSENPIQIERARIGSISVYDVTEDELEIIEQGPIGSVYLNICVASFSIGLTFILTLTTATFSDLRWFTVCVVIAVLTIMSGIITLIIWLQNRKNYGKVFKRIKGRKNTALKKDIEPNAILEAYTLLDSSNNRKEAKRG